MPLIREDSKVNFLSLPELASELVYTLCRINGKLQSKFILVFLSRLRLFQASAQLLLLSGRGPAPWEPPMLLSRLQTGDEDKLELVGYSLG